MLALICVSCIIAQPALTDLSVLLEKAGRTYDLAGGETVLSELEKLPDSASAGTLRVRAHLLCAELQRISFEDCPESSVKERRELGKYIDSHAEAGLLAVEQLEESSERYRMKADLIGTQIRSNYRAGKMKGEMKSAVDEALRLDPTNARALVSRAKMLVFNPNASPEELREGLVLLQKASEIDPALEQARLLHAYTLSMLGERDKAIAMWEVCLRNNPDCAPARRALTTKDGAGEKGSFNVK